MVTRIYYLALAAAVVLFGLVSLGVGAMGLSFDPTDTTSVITVTSTDDIVADDGVCTLREAITSANTDSPSGGMSGECPTGSGDDVLLVPTGTYSVAITGTRENNNATGDFDILNPVTILATGPVTLAVNNIDRAFHVLPTNVLTISGFTITNGHAPDGYMDEASGAGTDGEDGGTFLSEGDLSISNTTVNYSKAGRGGDGRWAGDGGLPFGNGGHGGYGGAIAHIGSGYLRLSNATFINNIAGGGGNGGYTKEAYADGGDGGDGGVFFLVGTGTALLDTVTMTTSYSGPSGWPGVSKYGFGAYGLSGKGGAIAIIGDMNVSILNSHISDATNVDGVGGIGGGIYNEGTLLVEASVLSGNAAGDGRSTSIESSDTPTAGEFGGGLYNSGTAILKDCVFDGNRAGTGGHDGDGGSGTDGGIGGGIYHSGSSLEITRCTFTTNQGGRGADSLFGITGVGGAGGAIVASGTATVTDSIFVNNTAGNSGTPIFGGGNAGGNGGAILGVAEHTLTIKNSTFYNNKAGDGAVDGNGGIGGALALFGTNYIRRSTFSNNVTGEGGKFSGHDGYGGAIAVFGILSIEDSTIVDNTSGNNSNAIQDEVGTGGGGGIYNEGSAIITNTIIANNSAQGRIGTDCFGTITSGGYLLVEDDGECTIIGDTTSNIIGQDPQLAPLGDNGGSTPSHALLADSPAIDAGFCTTTEDQRGYPRPIDLEIATNAANACDIGAFERQAVNVYPDMLAVTEGGITDTYTLSLTLTPTAPVTITLIADDQVLLSPTSVVFGTMTWSLPQTITVSAIDDAIVEGLHTAIISHTVASDDPFYDGVEAAKVQVAITDNDLLPTATATATSTPLPTSTTTSTASHTPTTTSTETATRTPTATQTPTVTGTAIVTSTIISPSPTVSASATPIEGELRELYLPLVLHH